MSDFYKLFEECCYHKEKKSDLETIVLGDFNSNALKQQSNMFSAVKTLDVYFQLGTTNKHSYQNYPHK